MIEHNFLPADVCLCIRTTTGSSQQARKKVFILRAIYEDPDDLEVESWEFDEHRFNRFMERSSCTALEDVTAGAGPASVYEFNELVDGHSYTVKVELAYQQEAMHALECR